MIGTAETFNPMIKKHFNSGRKRPDMVGDKNIAKRPEVRKKISEAAKGNTKLQGRFDENANGWKGDKVKIRGLHQWVERHLGVLNKCEYCESTTAKRYDWANKSRRYLRELSDWVRLCRKCHIAYDKDKIVLLCK